MYNIQSISFGSLDPINVGAAFWISFLSHIQVNIMRFTFFHLLWRHHLWFSTSGLVAQHSKYFRWIAGPRKHGGSHWNYVSKWHRSWDTLGGIFYPLLATYVCKKTCQKFRERFFRKIHIRNYTYYQVLWIFVIFVNLHIICTIMLIHSVSMPVTFLSHEY